MADNQMVKIVFDFDLGNVPASAKKLSQYLKDNSLDLKFTKASVDGLSASLNQLATAQTKAGTAAAAAGNSVKKSNIQWTNLALVIQDLPYGFRGIQNNLPALIGGFAGMTGALYLVSSAIIALFTAWDNGMISFGKSSKIAEDYSKSLASTYSTEIVKLKALYNISTDVTKSMGTRLEAAKALKEEYPGLLSKYSDEDIALGKAKSSYDKLTTTIINYSRAKAAEGILTGFAAERLPLEIERTELLAKQRKAAGKDIEYTITSEGKRVAIGNKSVRLLKENAEAQTKINKKAAPYVKILEDTAIAEIELEKFREKAAKGKTSVGTLDDPNIKLLQAKQKYYKDDLLMYASYEQEILAAKRDLAVKQAELEKKDGAYIQSIKDTYNQLIINSQKNTADEIIKIQHKLGVEDAKESEKAFKEQERINNQILRSSQEVYEQQLKDANEYYQNKLNLATGDLKAQLAILKEEQLAYDLMYGFRLVGDTDYAKKSSEITKAKIQKENALIKESFDFLMQLGNGIMSALGPSLDMLLSKGASIGDVLKKAFDDLLKQLIKVTIAAAVAVLLISILFPTKLAAAGGGGKLFGGLFGQGMGLGKDLFGSNTPEAPKLDIDKPKFANGGIISGPTMGLMGEYPGARSNPEVVAPLDKLKGLIGGNNGGTLEARISGNDLLILMNKAQRNNNLSF
jgi:hypothetical protein